MFSLVGKIALVTGASGGIGDSISRALHEMGASVGVSGQRLDVLEKLASDLHDRVAVLPCDLSDAESAKNLINNASEKLGGSIDILVNNAGVTRDKLLLRMSDDDWRSPIEINLNSTFVLARSALRSMIKKKWGRIINITSVVGVMGNPGQANYSASKAGIIGMSKAIAHEVAGRGITVNCIAPGYIETPMTASLDESQQGVVQRMIPMNRFGKAQEIAHGVVYLSSEEAGYITGQTIHINGGMLMI